MKQFLKKSFCYVLLILFLMIILPYYIDPFNVFHVRSIRDNGVEPNKNYIKMSYILGSLNKFDSFLFGSSRVGVIHVDKIEDVKCYNMTYSAGIPHEHLQNIKSLLNKNVTIKRIYIGVDSLSYTENPNDHCKQPLRMPYEYLTKDKITLHKEYLDFKIIKNKLKNILNTRENKKQQDIFYSFGWWADYDSRFGYNWEKAEPTAFKYNFLEECLLSIKEIRDICDQNNIQLVIFTNPMFSTVYKASLDWDYFLFLRKLALITDYYNFSGYNDVTLKKENYYDPSHYSAEVGDIMLECMIMENRIPGLYEQGFGYHVTKENIEHFISVLERQRYTHELKVSM